MHAELCYADVLYLRAALSFLEVQYHKPTYWALDCIVKTLNSCLFDLYCLVICAYIMCLSPINAVIH